MWIFTRYGFFSAVCARHGDGDPLADVDESTIAIRARSRHHLQSLILRFSGQLGNAEIKTFSGSDYQFRIFVAKQAWASVCEQLADEINYDNFKSEVSRSTSGESYRYVSVLHKVWELIDEFYWCSRG